jgi:O-antigen/teichoic acid export membrane protein
MKSPAEVAYYSSAQMLMIAAWLMPQAYRAVIYPRLSAALNISFERFWDFYRTVLRLALLLGVIVSVGIALLSPIIVNLLYPADYLVSVTILQYLTIPLFCAFLSVPSTRAMLALHKESIAAIIAGVSMVVNIAANLILIPEYSMLGAAWAKAISGILLTILSYIYIITIRARHSSLDEHWEFVVHR